ncbi:MAG: HIT family protein [Alphaproteobacteria bacterium]|nr:HIT family protein [Alphaproteobacteria bacterium]MDP7222106.1 HIT family protein [Alphaproteobacteria bacterium]
MNQTMKTFGFPASLIREYRNWVVLLRPKQPTLGALVVVHKSGATALSDIDEQSFAELKIVTDHIEKTLGNLFAFNKINYMMLMMVDPHVHYHVIPRYEQTKEFAGIESVDAGWPALPQLGDDIGFSDAVMTDLLKTISDAWPVGRD